MNFQSRKRPRARSKLVRCDAEALEHVHEEVAQGLRVFRIEVKMLAMLEAAASEEDGQVLCGMAAAIAEVAAQKDGCPIE